MAFLVLVFFDFDKQVKGKHAKYMPKLTKNIKGWIIFMKTMKRKTIIFLKGAFGGGEYENRADPKLSFHWLSVVKIPFFPLILVTVTLKQFRNNILTVLIIFFI